MPVASNTSALNRSSAGAASGLKIPASSLACAAAMRRSWSIGVDTSASMAARILATGWASRGGPDPVAPSNTGPLMTGWPGS